MSGRQPDYDVTIRRRPKDGEKSFSRKVGAAWRTKSGDGINVRLDAGISVSTPDGIDLTLWPFKEGGGQRQAAAPAPAASEPGAEGDDIPF
jgi:hypothetical protein